MTPTAQPKHRRARGTGSVFLVRRIWWIAYRSPSGKRVKESSHSERKGDAVRLLEKRNGSRIHRLPIIRHEEALTFDDAAQAVIDDCTVNHPDSLVGVRRRIVKHLTPIFGGRRMADISAAEVVAYVAQRQAEGIVNRKGERRSDVTNAQVNRELQSLKRAFNLAIDQERIARRPKITLLQESAPRSGFFEREQITSVIAHLPEEIQPVIAFAYATGWRIASEVLRLEWRHVDLTIGEVRLDASMTKNNEGRVIHMSDEVRDVLQAQFTKHEALKKAGHIFPNVFWRMVADTRGGEKKPRVITSFAKAWRIACKAAGCPGKIPHDLRRTGVRNLVRAGIPERVAMMMTGHKTASVFQRYNITSDADLREAAIKQNVAAGR